MTVASITQELNTDDITVISNVTSVIANCNRISRLEAIEGQELENPAAIHVDFKVKHHKQHLLSVLAETEELGLILSVDDAIELGLWLIAMGLKDQSGQEIDYIFEKLFKLASELHS